MTDTDVHDLRPEPPRVLSPGDPGWDATRATFNLLTDQHPTPSPSRATSRGWPRRSPSPVSAASG